MYTIWHLISPIHPECWFRKPGGYYFINKASFDLFHALSERAGPDTSHWLKIPSDGLCHPEIQIDFWKSELDWFHHTSSESAGIQTLVLHISKPESTVSAMQVTKVVVILCTFFQNSCTNLTVKICIDYRTVLSIAIFLFFPVHLSEAW